MKFRISRVTGDDIEGSTEEILGPHKFKTINFENLQDLIDYSVKLNQSLILDGRPNIFVPYPHIYIYDDYIE